MHTEEKEGKKDENLASLVILFCIAKVLLSYRQLAKFFLGDDWFNYIWLN